jgi:hypothetical protein
MVEGDDTRDEMEGNGGGEGLSTPKKVIAGAALGVAVPAAVGVARKLLGSDGDDDGGDDGDDGDDDDASSEPTARERESSQPKRRSTSSTKTKAKAATKPKSKSRSTSSASTGTKARRATNRTREQLYRQATRLKIEGRSAMNKAQLERAIERAKSK